MKGLTPMERQLLQTVGRLQAEASEREQRLTERIDSLHSSLSDLSHTVQRLTIVCDSLVDLLGQA